MSAVGSTGAIGATGAVGAILLAGGRATRVGGAAKPLFEVGGRTLLGHAIAAARSVECVRITIVGPDMLAGDKTITVVREDPPFGGPAAAIVAALDSWRSESEPPPEWTLLLACDLPRADDVVAHLAAGLPLIPTDTEGVCLTDTSSRPQWLAGIYRTAALLSAAAALPDAGRGASVHALLSDLAIAVLEAPPTVTADVDTWEDLDNAKQQHAEREKEQK